MMMMCVVNYYQYCFSFFYHQFLLGDLKRKFRERNLQPGDCHDGGMIMLPFDWQWLVMKSFSFADEMRHRAYFANLSRDIIVSRFVSASLYVDLWTPCHYNFRHTSATSPPSKNCLFVAMKMHITQLRVTFLHSAEKSHVAQIMVEHPKTITFSEIILPRKSFYQKIWKCGQTFLNKS